MIDWLLSPLSWLLLAVLLGVLGWRWRGHTRWVLRAAVGLLVSAFAAMTPLVANGLVGFLERPVAAGASCIFRPPAVVVVLAGGVDRRPSDGGDFSVLSLVSRRRVDAGVLYWKGHPGSRLVMSGGPVGNGGPPRAGLLAAYAQWLGVPRDVIGLEDRSRNTWEAAFGVARGTAELQHTQGPQVALVTSAMHMPRAAKAFHAAGIAVCPVAADYRRLPVGSVGAWLPRASALQKSEAALHELVGLAYYRWCSRSCPSPRPAGTEYLSGWSPDSRGTLAGKIARSGPCA